MCEESHPLCLSLFESDGRDITELDTNTLNAVHSNAFLTPELATIRINLKGDSVYLLVPSTFKPQQVKLKNQSF